MSMTGGVTRWRALWLLPAILLSVAAHAGLGYALIDQPLATINPDALRAGSRPIRINRVPLDEITDDFSNILGNSTDDSPDPAALSESQILSAALLALDANPTPNPTSTPTDDTATPSDPVFQNPTEFDEAPPTDDSFTTDATLEGLSQDLAALPPIDLAALTAGPDPQNVPTFTQPQGGDAKQTASSTDAAQRLLARAGIATNRGTGTGLSAAPPPPTAALDSADRFGPPVGLLAIADADDPSAATSSSPPPIVDDFLDFAAAAVDATTNLELPINLDEDFEFKMTKFVDSPKPNDPAAAGYFKVDVLPRRSLRKIETMPKDIVFLIDNSISISRSWSRSIAQGVQDALTSLNPGDRFNIVFFSETPAFFSRTGVVKYNADTLQAAQQFLSRSRRGGRTDVNAAVSRLLTRDLAADRVYNLVLISDGVPTRGVMNTRELINLITRDNDLAAGIYCLGVGKKQNRPLLEFLAFRNRGFCVFVDDRDDAPAALRDLVGQIRYPLLKDIRLSVAGAMRGDEPAHGVFPRNPIDILQGRPFSLIGRFDPNDPDTDALTLRMIGLNNAKQFEFNFYGRYPKTARGDASLAQQWAQQKHLSLYAKLVTEGENATLRRQIADLESKYDIKPLE